MDILKNETLIITRIDSVVDVKMCQKNWKAKDRPVHIIAYSLEGSTDHFFDSQILTHKPGVIFYIPAWANYSARTTCPFVRSIAIHFDINGNTALDPATYPVGENKRLEFIFHDALKRYFRKEVAWQMRIMQSVYDIIATLAETQNQEEPNFLMKKRLDSAIELIQKNISNSNFSVEDAAKPLRVTKTHFERLFKEAYEITPLEYIRNLRLEYAKDLLRSPFFNISEIAYQCGFSDLYYFSKVFRKETGLSPSEYRKSR